MLGLAAHAAIAEVVETPAATVLRVPEAPQSPMMNRVIGLGLARPATEGDVDEALAAFEQGTTFYVAVAPGAQPAELSRWLEARGLEPGWGWMAFSRSVDAPPDVSTSVRIVEADKDDAESAFARIVRISYDLPETAERAIARAPAGGWHCLLALDGEEPAGAAALYSAQGSAYLGFAGTLPEHRGKGIQTALLAARIRLAADLGCHVVLTETGERRGDRPSNSYRNIQRAGFEEVSVTANWIGRR